jgi:hypothetical protein
VKNKVLNSSYIKSGKNAKSGRGWLPLGVFFWGEVTDEIWSLQDAS